MKNKIKYWLFTFLTLFLLSEVISYVGLNWISNRGIAVVYKPIILEYDTYSEYFSYRNSVLGWPDPNHLRGLFFDQIGARPSPAFPDPFQESCVALYGDSYTQSEVVEQYAWGDLLAKKINCRVNNFGVGGYGTDQSYLRFLRNISDSSDIVILNHMSENIVRNVNQFRDYMYSHGGMGFKPRFVLNEEDELQLIEMPAFNEQEYADFFIQPDKYLKHDYFVPGGEAGQQFFKFPYTFNLIKAFHHIRIKAKLKKIRGRSSEYYFDLYNPDHPTSALFITAAIMKNFVNEAKERGQKPVLTILPMPYDFIHFRKTGKWPYQNLIDLLEQQQLKVLNVGAYMMDSIGDQDLCGFFTDCFGHPNKKGDQLIANAIYEYLKDQGL